MASHMDTNTRTATGQRTSESSTAREQRAVRERYAHGHLDRGDAPWLIHRYRQTGDPQYAAAVIELHRPLAISRARKMRRPEVDTDDLIQVALMGMWKAIRRFDPENGAKFSTYAVRTMDGELKRYYRDHVWDVHVPRGLKRTSLQATKARRRYIATHGEEPDMRQLAEFSGISRADLAKGLQAVSAYRSGSLDKPVGDGSATRGDLIPDVGSDLDRDRLMDAYREIRRLPERQRRIVFLRFFKDLSQREIAERVGCSQMHVSRLLRRALGTLREELAAA